MTQSALGVVEGITTGNRRIQARQITATAQEMHKADRSFLTLGGLAQRGCRPGTKRIRLFKRRFARRVHLGAQSARRVIYGLCETRLSSRFLFLRGRPRDLSPQVLSD